MFFKCSITAAGFFPEEYSICTGETGTETSKRFFAAPEITEYASSASSSVLPAAQAITEFLTTAEIVFTKTSSALSFATGDSSIISVFRLESRFAISSFSLKEKFTPDSLPINFSDTSPTIIFFMAISPVK